MAPSPPDSSPGDEELLAVLATGIPLRNPSPGLRERVLRAGTPQPLTYIERVQGIWLPDVDAPVSTKELYCDSGERLATRLVRLAPGATLPSPALAGARTVVVVDGALSSRERTLAAGDSLEIVVDAGEWRAPDGALVLDLGTAHGETPAAAGADSQVTPWTVIGDGLRARLLMTGSRELSLVDAEPAATLAEHEHAGIEELFVVRGSCEVQGRWMHAGDYHRAMPGSHHEITRAGSDGCVLVSSVRTLG